MQKSKKLIKEVIKTQWIKSPVTQKEDRLTVHRKMLLKPYYGGKKTIHLRHTSYIIGSDPSCDLVLDDPFISAKHAKLLLGSDGGYSIEDLSSKNGIFINGTRVEKAKLPTTGSLKMGRSLFSWTEEKNEEELLPQSSDWILHDPKMRELLLNLRTISKSNLPILLMGETGTGKEILAQMIHQWSARANGKFVPVNGALAAGGLVDSDLFGHRRGAYTGAESARTGALLEANGGTLFLDEIADVPLASQVKLLRALESGEVRQLGSDRVEHTDFRLITATSQSLESKIEENLFRLDFYYRVAGYVVQIPALRDRPGDILAIARKLCEQKGITLAKNAEESLLSVSWPGNVRELKSVMERAVLSVKNRNQSVVEAEDLIFSSPSLRSIPSFDGRALTLDEIEAQHIRQVLNRNAWSRMTAAKELGIARSTLFEKMRKYKLESKQIH